MLLKKEHAARPTDSNQHPCMLAGRIRSAGVRKLEVFVLSFRCAGFLSALNFDCLLKTIPAHGGFADKSVIEISGDALFRFLAPGASF